MHTAAGKLSLTADAHHVTANSPAQTKTPPRGRGFLCDEALRYVFALAGIGRFLTLIAARRLLLSALLLPALLFFFSALIIRTITLLTALLLATLLATLFTIHCHSLVSILDCSKFGASHCV